MIGVISEMMELTFMTRALLVGSLASISAALLGVILILKRQAMIGNALSHVGFAIIGAALAFDWAPMPVTMAGVLITAVILLKIKNSNKLKSDSAIAMVSTSALAIGIAIKSLTTGLTLEICDVMFGTILAMSYTDVYISVGISISVALLFILFYRKLFLVTFDEDYAKASGLKVQRYTNLIAILTAVIIVVGMRMMGALLISSIIVFPVLTSMRLFKSFKSVVISSGVISLVSFLIGIYLSFVYDISTGAVIVLVNLTFFIIFYLIEKILK